LFLFSLRREGQVLSTAQVLVQISPVFCEAAAVAPGIEAWLASEGRVLSYGLVSALRWVVWDATWYLVNTSRGYKEDAERDMKRWTLGCQKLLSSHELPHTTLEFLERAARSAAEHCAVSRANRAVLVGLREGPVPTADASRTEFDRVLQELQDAAVVSQALLQDLKWMVWNVAWYPANKARGYHEDASEALVRATRHFKRCFSGDRKFRGVNLGGWFLLEPGPSERFWAELPKEAKAQSCEWECCKQLGDRAVELLAEHRKSFFGKDDFAKIRSSGLTHVRLPFGAWCIVGPSPGEPYVGPCLDALDTALDQLEAAGLQVLLDCHGAVGGESPSAPCGHKDATWAHWRWNPAASLVALRAVAERYRDRSCICAIGVANEPAETLDARQLACFYEDAIRTVRMAGMRAGEVTVLLPVFTEARVDEFLWIWEQNYAKYDDVAFDLHLYQCFGDWWKRVSLEQHLKQAEERAELLDRLPTCCVSEWSLAMPAGLTARMGEESKNAYRRFAQKQLKSYEVATHGWFFWTWKDSSGVAWSLRDCLDAGLVEIPGASCPSQGTQVP